MIKTERKTPKVEKDKTEVELLREELAKANERVSNTEQAINMLLELA